MILSLLLWFLGSQDASWPALPPKLQEDEALRQAYEAGLQNGTAEERNEAVESLLAALPTAEPAAQGEFLIGLAARSDLSFDQQLAPACHRLHEQWGPFSARIEEVLSAAAMPDASEHTVSVAPGALRIASALGLSAPSRVESIAGLLDHSEMGLQAREVLLVITGREFPDRAAFDAWWESAKEGSRVDWLVSANEALRSEVLAQWQSDLEAHPERALDAISSDKRDVRALGIEQIARVTADMVASNGSTAPEVLRSVLSHEKEARFRVAILKQLAPMLALDERLPLLQQTVMDQAEAVAVRLAASEGLVVLEAEEASFGALYLMLQGCYDQDAMSKSPPLPVRRRLLESMNSLMRSSPDLLQDLMTAVEVVEPKSEEEAAEGEASEEAAEGEGEEEQEPVFGPDPRLAELEFLLSRACTSEGDALILKEVYELMGGIATSQLSYGLLSGKSFPLDESTELDPVRPTAVLAFGAFIGRNGPQGDDIGRLERLLTESDEEVGYAAAEALGLTRTELGFVALAKHLGTAQSSESMTRRVLGVMKRGKHPAAVPYLLQFDPSEPDRARYRDILERQINGDVPTRLQAMEAMLARKDWEMAHRLDRAFPDRKEGEAPDLRQLQVRARAAAYWALTINPLPKAEDQLFATTFGRLSEVRGLDPTATEWALLEGRVHLRLGQNAEGVEDLGPVLSSLTPSADTDALVLAVLAAAQEAGLAEVALSWEESLPQGTTAETQKAIAALLDGMRPAAPVEPVVQGEGPDQPEAQASPAPAKEEGGGAEQTAEQPPKEEPAPEQPPTKEDPGSGGGEPKKSEEPASGDGNRS